MTSGTGSVCVWYRGCRGKRFDASAGVVCTGEFATAGVGGTGWAASLLLDGGLCGWLSRVISGRVIGGDEEGMSVAGDDGMMGLA